MRLGQPPGAPGAQRRPTARRGLKQASVTAGVLCWVLLSASSTTLFQVFSPSAMSVTAVGLQSQLSYLPTFYLITQ